MSPEELRERLERASLTPYRLSYLLGVEPNEGSKWTRGDRPVPKGRVAQIIELTDFVAEHGAVAVPLPSLGGVDEFDQAKAGGEGDDGSEVSFGLFAAERDALEALEPSDALFDAGAGFVEGAGEEGWLVLFVGLVGNHGSDAARSRGVPIGVAGVAFVADDGARLDVGSDVEQGFEVTPVGSFSAGQVEGDDVAGGVRFCVDFRGEAAARAAERLAFFPPFAPAADTCARTTVESNI